MSLFERFQQRFDSGAEPDGFALIVSVPHVPLRPCPSNRSPVPAGRSPRFITQLPLAFRLDDDSGWRHGLSENISRSGILFRTDRTGMGPHWDALAARGMPVEVLLEAPTDSEPPRKRHVKCEGKLVRTSGTDAAATPVSIAVAVRGYSVVPASPATDASPAREPGPRVPTPATAELRRHARVTVPRAAADIGEQRRSSRRRVALENPVIAEVTSDGGEGTSAAGRVASLGPEGAYLELSEDYPIGCPLNICFKLPPLVFRDHLFGHRAKPQSGAWYRRRVHGSHAGRPRANQEVRRYQVIERWRSPRSGTTQEGKSGLVPAPFTARFAQVGIATGPPRRRRQSDGPRKRSLSTATAKSLIFIPVYSSTKVASVS